MRGAGLNFEQINSNVDEDSLKLAMRADGESTMRQAEALAEMKAIKVSQANSGIVLGADQMLDLEGEQFDKPKTMEEARENLLKMRGKTHSLETALVACENGQPIWRAHTKPRLTMRNFSEEFIDQYLEKEGNFALSTVGAYRLEDQGSQLFTKIEGDYFSILGLPLLQLLNWLQDRGVLVK
jgi:septum formation protein